MNLLYEMVLHDALIIGFVVGFFAGLSVVAMIVSWKTWRRR